MVYKIKTVLSLQYMRRWFGNFVGRLVKEKIWIKFVCFNYQHYAYLILKFVRKAASEFLSGFLSLSLVDFLQWSPLIGRRKNPHTHTSWAVYGTIFRITAGFQSKFYRNKKFFVSGNNFCRGSLKEFEIKIFISCLPFKPIFASSVQ